ncbi:MAG: hypothetical protein HKM02_11605 [Pseudomonadales bacterium]|nr:hypothetical protein [Pseudomonadales bacterium]
MAGGLLTSIPVQAAQKICVFDLLGAQGDVFSQMKDYKLEAAKWGADIELKPYTDERIAAEDFKAGQCDGVVLTGLRARQFDKFSGSIDSIGAVTSYKQLHEVIATLAEPKLAKYMTSGDFEIAGISPMGAAYLFVNDRSINNVSKLSGKKIAVLDYDKAQAKMVQKVGAQPVASDITNFAGKFNNGSVDIIAAPAAAFKPLELYKGLGTRGAIVKFPLAQLTIQIVIRADKFPAGFGQKAREYVASRFDHSLSIIQRAEASIDPKYWMDLPQADKDKYMILLRDSRISLTHDGIYDAKAMSFLKHVRCHDDPSNAECSDTLE